MIWIDAALRGRALQWFLVIVAGYLGYQVWLNAVYFGAAWRCWDHMLISGFVAFIVAIWLARDVADRLDRAIDGLRLNNALIVSDEGVAQLKDAMSVRGRSFQLWSALLIGLLIFCSYAWVFSGVVRHVWVAWRGGTLPQGAVVLAEIAAFTLISALCAALAGMFFGRLAHYGTLAGVLSLDDSKLRISPGHFDGASGLRPIGDFYLYQAVLLAIPILWLGAWWAWIIPTYKDVVCSITGQPQFLFREWQVPFFIMWLVVLIYFHLGFGRPFLALHRRIRRARLAFNGIEAQRLEQEIRRVQAKMATADTIQREVLAEGSETLARRLWSIRNMWDWPMDALTLAKYRSLVIGEVLLPIAASIAASPDIGLGLPLGLGGRLQSLGPFLSR